MAKYDRMSTLFLVALGVLICEESLRLVVGSFSEPGPGLFPLGCGFIIVALSLFVFACTYKYRDEGLSIWENVTEWGNLVTIPVSLIGYAFLIEPLGFRLITFLWMAFICRSVGKLRWKASLFTAFMATFLSFILFQHYLGVRFPRGIFRF